MICELSPIALSNRSALSKENAETNAREKKAYCTATERKVCQYGALDSDNRTRKEIRAEEWQED
jgi:hypothetical protein